MTACRAGYIKVPVLATYTFSMDNDDGAQLYINGQLIIAHLGARTSLMPPTAERHHR